MYLNKEQFAANMFSESERLLRGVYAAVAGKAPPTMREIHLALETIGQIRAYATLAERMEDINVDVSAVPDSFMPNETFALTFRDADILLL